jgi:hypothetical protein
MKDTTASENTKMLLSPEQLATFLQKGVLVVGNVLSKEKLEQSLEGLSQTLGRHGVMSHKLDDEDLAQALTQLSSTNGSGGVLDLFYETWKMNVATNPQLFALTTQLWEAAYCNEGEEKDDLPLDERFRWHPYGPFECTKGYMYIDRIGYRLPTLVAEGLGERINGEKKKKARAVQRSLTPHLDCCPDQLFDTTVAKKWRPIQCFVSLTHNTEPNTGEFEAVAHCRFHGIFDEWALTRAPTTFVPKENGGSKVAKSVPPPCVGKYTHMQPKED